MNTNNNFQEIINEYDKYDFLRLERINLKQINETAKKLSTNNVIVIGVGASSLNIKAVTSILPNPSVIYLDNIHQVSIDAKLSKIDISRSIFFAISNSGNTHETYILTKYILGKVSSNQVCIISPVGDNLMFQLANEYNTEHIKHEHNISGRFGVLGFSSLLISKVIGVDIEALLKHIKLILSQLIKNNDTDNYIRNNIINIAHWYLSNYALGRHMLIMFNYCHQLNGLCQWKQQLIGESLGKDGFGITPIIAKGTFDQHTQLQLYLDGPDDKWYEIIVNNNDNSYFAKDLQYHIQKIQNAFNNRPMKLISLKINEQIIAQSILEIIFVVMLIAKCKGINPFNQPLVDHYKLTLDEIKAIKP